jgi:hypothetical protein
VIWRQGIKRDTRGRFWRYLFGMARQNPAMLEQFIVVLAHNEHFMEYRAIVQQKSANSWNQPMPTPEEPLDSILHKERTI